jgi:hypothetical protein
MFGWLGKINLGKNWKTVTGGVLLMITGGVEVVSALKYGLDVTPGAAKIAAGLTAIGFRDAMGKR